MNPVSLRTLLGAFVRLGATAYGGPAMMATLRCDHPDIETFVDAKRDPAALRHFNLSVQVSDAFMAAVANDRDWPLVFPGLANARTLKARDLWQRILRAAYDTAEPGVLFVDDEVNILKALARLFRQEPVRVYTASSAGEALALLLGCPTPGTTTPTACPAGAYCSTGSAAKSRAQPRSCVTRRRAAFRRTPMRSARSFSCSRSRCRRRWPSR